MLGLRSPLICFLMLCIWQRLATAIPYRGMSDSFRHYYDNKCTDTGTGRELYIGQSFTRPGSCVRVQCLGDLQLWEDRCEVPDLEVNCAQLPPSNEFLDYPECCPMYQCKKYTRNQNGQCEEIRTYDHTGTLRNTTITQIFIIRDLQTGKGAGEAPKTQFEI